MTRSGEIMKEEPLDIDLPVKPFDFIYSYMALFLTRDVVRIIHAYHELHTSLPFSYNVEDSMQL